MLDRKLIREHRERVEKELRKKIPDISLDELALCDEALRKEKTAFEELQAKRNELSKKIGELKRTQQSTDALSIEVAAVNETIKQNEDRVRKLEEKYFSLLEVLPNIPMPDVPFGVDPKENVVLRTHGTKREFDFSFKNHVELNEQHKLFDFEKGAKTTGSGWPFYRGVGAQLEWALLQYMVQFHVKNGYELWLPPLVVREKALYSCGQLPKFAHQQYRIDSEEHSYFLIPTAEVALNGMYMDEILDEEILPLKYAAYSSCFRREAGGLGAQERGLIRMHQFNKVEMFSFCTPEMSPVIFEEMLSNAEQILKDLELHFRTMLLVTGDMSFQAAKTVDIEVWLPGQNRYYEVSSVSNCTDYPARRGNMRFRRKNQKPEFLHTLNGSGLATSRLFVAIVENNQQEDGSIVVPKVLRPYLGKDVLFPER